MTKQSRYLIILIATLSAVACGNGKPDEASLRESFGQQMSANKFIKDFQKNGDDLTFTGPGAEGGTAKWKIHIDSAVIEDNAKPEQPYKGTVKSSWYSDGQQVIPSMARRESHLPIELMDNGLAQECYAFWEKDAKKWSWE